MRHSEKLFASPETIFRTLILTAITIAGCKPNTNSENPEIAASQASFSASAQVEKKELSFDAEKEVDQLIQFLDYDGDLCTDIPSDDSKDHQEYALSDSEGYEKTSGAQMDERIRQLIEFRSTDELIEMFAVISEKLAHLQAQIETKEVDERCPKEVGHVKTALLDSVATEILEKISLAAKENERFKIVLENIARGKNPYFTCDDLIRIEGEMSEDLYRNCIEANDSVSVILNEKSPDYEKRKALGRLIAKDDVEGLLSILERLNEKDEELAVEVMMQLMTMVPVGDGRREGVIKKLTKIASRDDDKMLTCQAMLILESMGEQEMSLEESDRCF